MRVFEEIQRFNQWWIQLLNIALLAFLCFCLYNWYVQKESMGNVLANDTIGQIVVIASIIPVVVFLYFLKLSTFIDEIGVHYQFFPFHFSKRTIRWNEVKNCFVRSYSPIKEYGGWGYRVSLGKKGKALNVKGNKGIQMELKNGNRLLLGTQMPNEAHKVIGRFFKVSNE